MNRARTFPAATIAAAVALPFAPCDVSRTGPDVLIVPSTWTRGTLASS